MPSVIILLFGSEFLEYLHGRRCTLSDPLVIDDEYGESLVEDLIEGSLREIVCGLLDVDNLNVKSLRNPLFDENAFLTVVLGEQFDLDHEEVILIDGYECSDRGLQGVGRWSAGRPDANVILNNRECIKCNIGPVV